MAQAHTAAVAAPSVLQPALSAQGALVPPAAAVAQSVVHPQSSVSCGSVSGSALVSSQSKCIQYPCPAAKTTTTTTTTMTVSTRVNVGQLCFVDCMLAVRGFGVDVSGDFDVDYTVRYAFN